MKESILTITIVAILAGSTTGLGGFIATLWKPNPRYLALGLGFSGGVMLGVTFLSLLPVSLKGGFYLSLSGFVAGAALLAGLNFLIPHRHIPSSESEVEISSDRVLADENNGSYSGPGPTRRRLRSEKEWAGDDIKNWALRRAGLLIALGIAIHDFPEGLAIGSGYGISAPIGVALAIAIALHNIPEGIAIALPLYCSGTSRVRCFLIAFATDIPTLLGALLAYYFATVFPSGFVYAGLAFAGGAMFYITVDELLPRAYESWQGRLVTYGVTVGVIIAFLLTRLS